jgi:hypothetical protein
MGRAGAGYGGPRLNVHIIMHVGSRLSVTTLRATLAGRGSKRQGSQAAAALIRLPPYVAKQSLPS